MAGPWEKYQSSAADDSSSSSGPWSKYQPSEPAQNSSFQDKLKNAPGLSGSLARSGQYAINRLADVEQGAVAAVPKAAQFVAQALTSVIPDSAKKSYEKMARTTGIFPSLTKDYMQETAPIGSGEQGFIPEMAREAGGYLPYGALGELKALPQATGTLKSVLGKSILGEMLAGGVHGGVNAKEDQENLGGLLPSGKFGSALEGAGMNVLGSGLAQGIAKGLEALRPSKLLRGNLSEQELADNLKAAEGTQTSLGNVIGNRSLQRTSENILPSIPFSGAPQTAERSAQTAVQRGENLLNRFLGENSPQKPGLQLQNVLKETKNKVQKNKEGLFNALNDEASRGGDKTGASNTQNAAQIRIDQINKDPRLAASVPDAVKKDLELAANTNIPQDFKETGVLRGQYGANAKKYSMEGNDFLAGVYSDLKSGVQKDWDAAIDASGNENLRTMRDAANLYYKENYAPFKDPLISKFIDKGGDADTLINSFVKSGKEDRSIILEKLTSKLPEDKKGLLTYGYYKKALKNGKFNPNEFSRLDNNLGEEQRKILLPDEASRNEADEIKRLAGMNKKGISPMFNPENGAKNAEALGLGALFAAGTVGASTMGPIGAVLLPALMMGGAKGANKVLTSENVRNSLIKAMLEDKQKFKAPIKTAQTLTQAIAGTNQ